MEYVAIGIMGLLIAGIVHQAIVSGMDRNNEELRKIREREEND